MEFFSQKLRAAGFRGEIDTTAAALSLYSHDASMFELSPKMVVFPVDAADVALLTKIAGEAKKTMPELSLTARAAGTDMSGGAINDSVIVNFTEHFKKIGSVSPTSAVVQPGVFYRDFEKQTLQ